ncbi:acetyl-CoA carboxylase carboxyltransferase subunit beta [Lacticaseibacillus daqingensis]|uniref:acetyl-CoA carboxylase carboxyltransferase subunit beta n=1 Tax=Lacticaseibacillus daqingensis TaxID=2486014 RepID=UPI000F7B52F8|nr:acetyl-CoA carboxylase carboxyltransferase subunit beta [Lacticaseibacillus daqingensis]
MRPNAATLAANAKARESALPDDLWVTCGFCHRTEYRKRYGAARVCVHCGYGLRLTTAARLAQLTHRFTPWDEAVDLKTAPAFPGYAEKRAQVQATTGQRDSVQTGLATIEDQRCALAVMAPDFMMGSLGQVAGERLTRLFARATAQRLPVVVLTASGGARMQEGILALMQMAKVSAAVAAHSQAGLFYLTVLTDPTMGGVTASFAMQGDIIIAEPHAMIGFAGRRVIESTINQQLPHDFQRAETALKQGFVDLIVPRPALAKQIAALLAMNGGVTHD